MTDEEYGAFGDVTEDGLRERVSGEQMVHRLREWTDGDSVYGVSFFSENGDTSTGKTFREGAERVGDAEQMARERYEHPGVPMSGLRVLYRATVQNPRTDPQDPMDPGEPPLKFATLTDVEILDWKQSERPEGDGDE